MHCKVRLLIQSPGNVPAPYDLPAIVDMQLLTDTTPDEKRFRALFEQYFQFDVRSQQLYLYREVQRFLAGLFVELTKEKSDKKLCLTSFDPVLVFNGNKDILVESLLETCLVLVRRQLWRQYREVCEYFRQKWQSQSNEGPVADDVLSFWLTHPP